MEKDNSEDVINDSINYKESEEDKSFVTKVRSRVSGLFNSSFSRLFGNQESRGSTVRRRENDDDTYENQPPRKRAKGPEDNFSFNNYYKDNHISNSNIKAPTTIFNNFAEPVAGPSGIRTQKNYYKTFSSSTLTQNDINGEKDSDSGESTSGYSSMAKIYSQGTLRHGLEQKNAPIDVNKLQPENKSTLDDKSVGSKTILNSSAPEILNRSLFANRSLSPQVKNTSLSSRRPSFNTSNFGSPNFVDRTITTKKIINSPFYNGPTIYGGASAYGRLGLNESRRQQLKNSFVVKPVNKSSENNPCTSLSKTARRILNTLEQYSTPISDAKKIPMPTKVEKQEGLLSKYVGVNPYRIRESRVSSNRELLVPTVPELLQMKEKQRLQDTTDKIRRIATSSNSSLITEDYKIAEDNQQKHKNKIKASISSVRPKAPAVEILENVALKPVQLPISETQLPKFDFVIPPPDCAKNSDSKNGEVRVCTESKSTPVKTSENKANESTKKDIITEYTFSKPLVIADNLNSIVAINNFKFSEPVSKKICLSEKDPNKVTKNVESKEKKAICGNSPNVSIVAQNLVESLKNKSDPIMAKFKAPEGSWECSTCLIRNKSDAIKCAACETLRKKESPKVAQIPSLPGFGVQFNKKLDEWECTSCLIRNKNQNEKCVACCSPKPLSSNKSKTNGFGNKFKMSANEWECKTCLIRNKMESSKCMACETLKENVPAATLGFGDKFKAPSDTWECQTCLIRNKADVNKCAACETSRNKIITENKFGDQFKPPSGTWECDTCLIRNKNELSTCAACQTPREKIFAVNTSKKPSDKWECPTCMVRNDSQVEKCPCCETTKPGVTLISKNTVNMFNFGVSKTQFNFGIPKDKIETKQSVPPFIYGAPDSSATTESKSVPTATNPVFTFGIKPGSGDAGSTDTKPSPVAESTSKPDVKNSPTAPLFKFGTSDSTTAESITAKNTPSTGFQLKPAVTATGSSTVPSLGSSTTGNFKFGSSAIPTSSENTPASGFHLKQSTVTEPSKVQGLSTNVKFGSFAPSVTQLSSTTPSTNTVFKFDGSKPLLPNSVTNNTTTNAPVELEVNKLDTVKPSFGTTKTQEENTTSFTKTNSANLFSFGKTDNTAKESASKPLFSFGSASSAPGGFSFAPNANGPKPDLGKPPQPKSTSGFSFSGPKSDTNLFATPSAPAAASTTKNGGFNFGSASVTNNQAAVFSFGAPQNPPQAGVNAVKPTGGFNFASPAVPPGGFNFSAPASTFGGNAKPTFNFTGGAVPTFAATPSEGGGPVPVRKFKKAVRRTAQR